MILWPSHYLLLFELAKARADAVENIAALDAKLKSTEVHSMDVAGDGEKCLRDFGRELV
jgi:hypothetical protein